MNTAPPISAVAGPGLHAQAVARGEPSPRLLVALVLALAVLVLEVAGGLVTGSLALLSDATHVAVDVAALLVGFTAARLATREPDANHSYGFHRMESIGALVNGALLVAASAAVLAESVGRLLAPTAVEATGVLGVAVLALVTNTVSAILVHGIARRTSATRVLVLHLAGDATGSSAVIAASLVILAGGPPVLDAVASLAIGVLLGVAGLRLLGDVVHILAEGVPAQPTLASAGAALRAVPGASGIHDLHVWALAEDLPLVTAHLELQAAANECDVLPAATDALRRIGVAHATLQLEHEPCGQGRADPAAGVTGTTADDRSITHAQRAASRRINPPGSGTPDGRNTEEAPGWQHPRSS
jgi:cobalt-zinc-cadmium efflux system protein